MHRLLQQPHPLLGAAFAHLMHFRLSLQHSWRMGHAVLVGVPLLLVPLLPRLLFLVTSHGSNAFLWVVDAYIEWLFPSVGKLSLKSAGYAYVFCKVDVSEGACMHCTGQL